MQKADAAIADEYYVRTQNGVVLATDRYPFSVSWVNTRTDASNPLWREEVKAHVSATTAISGTKRNFSLGDCKSHVAWGSGDKNNGWGTPNLQVADGPSTLLASPLLSLIGDSSSLNPSAALSAAKIGFLAKVRKTQRQFQAGVFLGELRETIHMIRRPAQALRNALDLYHGAAKERIRRAGSNRRIATRAVQDTWLEYVFGWSPLINDVQDAAKALGYKDYREYIPITYKAGTESAETTENITGYSVIWAKCSYTRKDSVVVRLKGEVASEPSSTELGNLDRWGVNPWRDFVPTVWELIPYSFLVDYFTNIGNVIDGFSTQTANIAWVNQTVRKTSSFENVGVQLMEKETRVAIGDRGNNDTDIGKYHDGSASCSGYSQDCVSFVRTSPSTVQVGVTDLRFRIPGVGEREWLNIAALARLRR